MEALRMHTRDNSKPYYCTVKPLAQTKKLLFSGSLLKLFELSFSLERAWNGNKKRAFASEFICKDFEQHKIKKNSSSILKKNSGGIEVAKKFSLFFKVGIIFIQFPWK